MIVYKLAKTKYARDLSGDGARLNGGRWNHKGQACLYTSETKALALLEYTVNVNFDDIPRALSIVAIEIPDNKILEVKIAELPGDWLEAPAPASTKDFGTDILRQLAYPVIRIPSVIIPTESNYLLNPLHELSRMFKIKEVKDFVYDTRLKKA